MGSSNSKTARRPTYPSDKSTTTTTTTSSYTHLEKATSELTLSSSELSPELSLEATQKWEDRLLADPKNRLALAALTTHAATSILVNPAALQKDLHLFSHKISLEGTPVTNQRSTGRCWLFASTNVFRVGLIKKYKLSGFELSQAYLFFWDKLEKANFFLEQVLDTLDEPVDGRLLQHLLSAPVGDGGQWDMVVNLVEKYGLVPQAVYEDSFNAKASARVNWLITVQLREAALKLRELAGTEGAQTAVASHKAKVLQAVHGILTLSLGVPPKPTDTFTWTYTDKESKLHTLTTTPLAFYKDNVEAVSLLDTITRPLSSTPSGIASRVSLVNDPRHPYLRLLHVSRLGNIHGARGVIYINVSMSTLKAAALASIKASNPVFFGCDVGKFSDSQKGIMDTALFDYELGFNVQLGMGKKERIITGESQMTHAMVLSGAHVEGEETKRWRVENSWGDARGDKGYFVMTDAWMDEYTYQAVVEREFVGKEVLDVLNQEPIVLPVWDPMGALA